MGDDRTSFFLRCRDLRIIGHIFDSHPLAFIDGLLRTPRQRTDGEVASNSQHPSGDARLTSEASGRSAPELAEGFCGYVLGEPFVFECSKRSEEHTSELQTRGL